MQNFPALTPAFSIMINLGQANTEENNIDFSSTGMFHYQMKFKKKKTNTGSFTFIRSNIPSVTFNL